MQVPVSSKSMLEGSWTSVQTCDIDFEKRLSLATRSPLCAGILVGGGGSEDG